MLGYFVTYIMLDKPNGNNLYITDESNHKAASICTYNICRQVKHITSNGNRYYIVIILFLLHAKKVMAVHIKKTQEAGF